MAFSASSTKSQLDEHHGRRERENSRTDTVALVEQNVERASRDETRNGDTCVIAYELGVHCDRALNKNKQ